MIVTRLPFSPIALVGIKFIGWWSQSDPRYHQEYKDGAYWEDADNDNCKDLPSPIDFINTEWDPKEKEVVVQYLKRSVVVQECKWFAPAQCRICDSDSPDEFWDMMGMLDCIDVSGTFYHPEGFIHYVEKHNVKPPQEFIEVCKRGE